MLPITLFDPQTELTYVWKVPYNNANMYEEGCEIPHFSIAQGQDGIELLPIIEDF